MKLKSQIESLLFISIKPMSVKDISGFIKAKPEEIESALGELETDYASLGRGLSLVKNNSRYQLTTTADNAELVKTFLQAEVSGELSQPSLEALTIIAYRGPISKLELDRLRGVNCSLIVRNLLLRGLIEEKMSKNENEYYYTVTHEFIRWLGLSDIRALPEYETLNKLSLNPTSESQASTLENSLKVTD